MKLPVATRRGLFVNVWAYPLICYTPPAEACQSYSALFDKKDNQAR
jgi:hypothetical protein